MKRWGSKRTRAWRRAPARAALALGTLLAGATAAPAQAPRRFDVRLVPAGAVLGAAGVAALAPLVLEARLPYATCAPCDLARLPGIDRGTVGAVRNGPAAASDAALILTGAGAAAWLWSDRRGDAAAAVGDLVVLAQAVGTATAVTNWAKVVFHRPRPVRYTAEGPALAHDPETGLSFPSGHTAGTFAAAAAYWAIESRLGRARAHRWRIATLVAAAAATGALRVAAREHFPTDVLAGAVVGTAVGFAVPRLYPLRR